ncbi:PDZ domain-containing protein [Sphingomonas sp. AP4-R1]|uniref:PDZ domain-containing protein n=1 Tax=Sphingomonas sp. AP4-R1 TaxID=2735134 RepID=UPI001C1254DF|nr:PDZ domain-containing protein [Sphingomonas sp. AP4-R1]
MARRSEFRVEQLSGLTLTLYRALMAVLLLIAAIGIVTAYGQQRDAQASVGPTFAASLRFPGGNDVVTRVAPFSDEARARGLLPGDRLIAIDGRAIPYFDLDAIQSLLAGPDGSTYRLTVQTGEASPRTITLTRNSHYIDQAYAGSGLTFAIRSWTVFGFRMLDAVLALATALLLFIRRPTDPVAAMLALCAVPLENGLLFLWPDAGLALTGFSSVRHMLFLTTILIYPNGRFVPRWTIWLTPLIPVIELVSFQSTTVEAAIGLRQLLLFAFLIAAAGAFYLRYRSTPPGAERQQIKLIMLGTVGWVLFGLVSLVLERISAASATVAMSAWFSLASHLAGSFAAIALEAGILLSLLRLRLYDADSLISRSAAYTFLTLLLGPTFAATDKVVQVLSAQSFGENARAMSAGFGAAIAATLIAPLNKRVRRWTELRFQGEIVALRDDLPKHVGDLREFATLDVLLAGVLDRIRQGIRTRHVAILLRGENGGFHPLTSPGLTGETVLTWAQDWQPEPGNRLEGDRDDPLFPVRIRLGDEEPGMIGWILLGPRPDGSFFGKDERKALAEIAAPIALAIRIVRERDARMAGHIARNRELEERIATLESRLGAFRDSA